MHVHINSIQPELGFMPCEIEVSQPPEPSSHLASFTRSSPLTLVPAMRTGDQHAVYWMYNALIKSEIEGSNPSLVRDQLGGEYGMKIEEGDDSKSELATSMSTEEIVEACTQLGIPIHDLVFELSVEGQL